MAKRGFGGRRAMGSPRAPYPFVYSRDIWDVRRFYPLGRGPSVGSPSQWAVRFAVALIIALLGGSLVLLLAQAAQAIFR